MLRFNSAIVNNLKRLGAALSSLKFNGTSIWPVSRDSVFTFDLSSADPSIDLWLTQSAAGAVTVTMDDGMVLTSNQLKAEFPYRFASGGAHTVIVSVEDGETWIPGANFGSTNSKTFVGTNALNGDANTTLKTAVFGSGARLGDADAFGAFYRCTGLTSIDFSASDMTSITWDVFGECSSLVDVVWGSIRDIGDFAFHDCGFVELHIPATVETVGQQAFSSLDSLLRIEIAAKYVDPQAVAHCPNLEYIWVRNTCVELRANSTDQHEHTTQWNGCNPDAMFCCEAASKPAAWGNLYDAYEYESGYLRYNTVWNQTTEPWNVVPGATEATFVLTSNLTQHIYFTQSQANGVTIDWGDGSATETVAALSAHASHAYAAAGTYVVGMTAGNGVTWQPGAYIGSKNYGFIGEDVNKGGNYPTLTAFSFGTGCSLREYSFAACTGIAEIVIPAGTIELPNYAFKSCTALESITIPPSLRYGHTYTFDNMTSITEIHISDLAAYCALDWVIEDTSNWMCFPVLGSPDIYLNGTKITDGPLVVPSGVTKIGNDVFANAIFTSVTLPDSVTSVGHGAFSAGNVASTIQSFTLGANPISFGKDAFSNRTVTSVYAPSLEMWFGCTFSTATPTLGLASNPAWDSSSALYIGGQEITGNLEIPASITAIRPAALQARTRLTKVWLHNTVDTIQVGSFTSGSQTNRVPPFYQCSSSCEIYCEDTAAKAGWDSYWNGGLSTVFGQTTRPW